MPAGQPFTQLCRAMAQAKPTARVDLHMHTPGNWTLGRAAAVRASVEQALMAAVPGLRTTIQLFPSDVEPHLEIEDDRESDGDLV